MASFQVEVIADSTGEWYSNAMRYTNRSDAEDAAVSLAMRWAAVRDYRVVESDDEPNDGKQPAPVDQQEAAAVAAAVADQGNDA